LGYGFTTTGVHEFGHHIGMSHPHDGYDSELDFDFDASGPLEFAWSGDESHTIMSYISTANGFGRFDRDNAYRWETAGYLNWSNAVLGDLLADPHADRVKWLVAAADKVAAESLEAFDDWNFLKAAAAARATYSLVALAAQQIGAATPTMDAARRALPGPLFARDGCRLRNPYN
jgi:hypothetical protein